jgi:hypothetical protein
MNAMPSTQSFDLAVEAASEEKQSRSSIRWAIVAAVILLVGSGDLFYTILQGTSNPQLSEAWKVGPAALLLLGGLVLIWSSVHLYRNPSYVRVTVSSDQIEFVSSRPTRSRTLVWTGQGFYLKLIQQTAIGLAGEQSSTSYTEVTGFWTRHTLSGPAFDSIVEMARCRGVSVEGSSPKGWGGSKHVYVLRAADSGPPASQVRAE